MAREIWAVIPVKDFALAKQRLAHAFSPLFRRRLARAMLADVLTALRGAEGLAGIVVITADPEAGLLAQHYGARLLFERRLRGLNAAVSEAAAGLNAERRDGMLVIPGDIPSVTSREISQLMASHGKGRAVSLVPAHDRHGTNALLVSPPQVMTFSFGPMSFPLHRASAEDLGIEPRVHNLVDFPGFALDVDTPDEVRRLGCLRPGSPTRQVLVEEGLLPAASAP